MQKTDRIINIEAEKISTASEFLLLAFFQWQQIEGGKKTNAEFAEWIGITPQQMNQYLKGTRSPSAENTKKISDKLGPGIYITLGLIPPDEELYYLNSRWVVLPQEKKDEILAIIRENVSQNPDFLFEKDGKHFVVHAKYNTSLLVK